MRGAARSLGWDRGARRMANPVGRATAARRTGPGVAGLGAARRGPVRGGAGGHAAEGHRVAAGAVVLAVWLSVLSLWRRTRPLAMVALGFGATILLQVASLVASPREPVGLYTSLVVLVLVYALPRWGSGREVVLGGVVIVATVALSAVTDDTPAAEEVVGFGFLLLPAVIGASVRFRTTARERQLEHVRSRERERLARELHDTVAHHVSAMVIRAQAGRVVAGGDPAPAVEALEGVEEEGARTLEEMRSIVAALRNGGAGAELTPPAGVADPERLVRAPGGRLPVRLTNGG